MAANERVTKAGVYVEESGGNLHATKTGVYVELQLPTTIEDAVTKAGAYVELTNTMDRVTQAGVYVELHGEILTTQVGAYVELHPEILVTQVGAYVELHGKLLTTKAGAYVELYQPVNPPTLASQADFTATLSAFDFLPIVNPPFALRPVRWSWQDLGVSNEAEIAVDGQLNSLINWLPELPRMPVSIYNPLTTCVWSGFVNGVEVQIDDLILSITLDGLANRVIVAYNELAEGDTTKAGAYVELYQPVNPPTLASQADFTATLSAFDFLPIVNPPFALRPVRWGWQDLGVSNEAEIAVEGQLNSIINWLPELPRMPIAIFNPLKTDVWSGFVNAIEVRIDDLILSITLDGLANRVIVAYNELAEGDTTSTAAYTTIATNGESVARYGYHELLYVYGDASADQAEALRDRILADLAAIQSETRFDESQGVSARLLCKGWIHSAGWRIFDESSTTNATIADQVGQVASLMESINVIDIKDDNTIESNPYTEPVNAYDKLAALLAIADQDGDTRRMVIPQIGVFRYEKVYRNEDQYIFSNGRFYRANGYPLQPGEFILGYCRDIGKRMIGNLANANRFYVEESEYEAESGQYTIRTRGTPSPWR